MAKMRVSILMKWFKMNIKAKPTRRFHGLNHTEKINEVKSLHGNVHSHPLNSLPVVVVVIVIMLLTPKIVELI